MHVTEALEVGWGGSGCECAGGAGRALPSNPISPPPPPRPHTKSRSPPSLRSLQPAAWRHGAALLSPRPAGPPRDPRTPPAPSQLGHMGAPPAALRTGQSPIAWGPPARAPSSTGDPSTGLQVPGSGGVAGGAGVAPQGFAFPIRSCPAAPAALRSLSPTRLRCRDTENDAAAAPLNPMGSGRCERSAERGRGWERGSARCRSGPAGLSPSILDFPERSSLLPSPIKPSEAPRAPRRSGPVWSGR